MSFAIPIATTLASLAGGAYAASQSAKANKKTQDLLDHRISDTEGFMNQEYHRNALESKESQSALARVQQQLSEMLSGFQNNAVSSQSTPEAQVAARGEAGKNHSDAVMQILQSATAKKDQNRRSHEYMLQNLFNTKLNLSQQQGQVWDQLMQNMGGASGGIMDAWGEGAFDKKKG